MKPNSDPPPLSRREEVVDAALQVLASEGSRGLTHREVDRFLGRPMGSTSNYYRKRIDLLTAVGSRVMELDLADAHRLTEKLARDGKVTTASVSRHLFDLLDFWASPPQRARALARIEIIVEAVRSAELRVAVRDLELLAVESFRGVFEQLRAHDPLLSADLFLRLLTSLQLLILSDLQRAERDQMVRGLLKRWIEISLEASTPAGRGQR